MRVAIRTVGLKVSLPMTGATPRTLAVSGRSPTADRRQRRKLLVVLVGLHRISEELPKNVAEQRTSRGAAPRYLDRDQVVKVVGTRGGVAVTCDDGASRRDARAREVASRSSHRRRAWGRGTPPRGGRRVRRDPPSSGSRPRRRDEGRRSSSVVLARLLTWDATGVIVGDGSCGIGRVHRGDHASLFSTAPSAVRPSEGDVLVVIIIHTVSGPGRRVTPRWSTN